jgi:hypothetical protein
VRSRAGDRRRSNRARGQSGVARKRTVGRSTGVVSRATHTVERRVTGIAPRSVPSAGPGGRGRQGSPLAAERFRPGTDRGGRGDLEVFRLRSSGAAPGRATQTRGSGVPVRRTSETDGAGSIGRARGDDTAGLRGDDTALTTSGLRAALLVSATGGTRVSARCQRQRRCGPDGDVLPARWVVAGRLAAAIARPVASFRYPAETGEQWETRPRHPSETGFARLRRGRQTIRRRGCGKGPRRRFATGFNRGADGSGVRGVGRTGQPRSRWRRRQLDAVGVARAWCQHSPSCSSGRGRRRVACSAPGGSAAPWCSRCARGYLRSAMGPWRRAAWVPRPGPLAYPLLS